MLQDVTDLLLEPVDALNRHIAWVIMIGKTVIMLCSIFASHTVLIQFPWKLIQIIYIIELSCCSRIMEGVLQGLDA